MGNSASGGKRKLYWTVIDGVKYDITDFVERHPGGSDMLYLGIGRDATVMFHSYHRRLETARAVLEKLPVLGHVDDDASSEDADVGTASRGRSPSRKAGGSKRGRTPTRATAGESDSDELWEDLNTKSGDNKVLGKYENLESDLYSTIRKRVNQYFKETGYSSRGGPFMWFKTMVLLSALFTSYYMAYVVVPEYALYIAPLTGVMMATVGLSIQHDANHGSFSPYPLVNRAFGLLDDMIGGSALMWRHQHNIAHHAHPNDYELDADSISNFPLVRMNPALPVHGYLKFQWLYAPVLYCFLGISYAIGDCIGFLKGAYEHVRMQPLRFVDVWTFVAGKLFFVALTFYLPYHLHGWSFTWKWWMILQMSGGNFLASVFAVSHNSEANDYNCDPDTDWAELQIRTSCNWSPQSTFWWLISGGLNFQIEHHLFPGVCHVHYPAIHKIVKKTCEEFDLPYNSYPRFRDIYRSHLMALYLLGRGEDHKIFHQAALDKIHHRNN